MELEKDLSNNIIKQAFDEACSIISRYSEKDAKDIKIEIISTIIKEKHKTSDKEIHSQL